MQADKIPYFVYFNSSIPKINGNRFERKRIPKFPHENGPSSVLAFVDTAFEMPSPFPKEKEGLEKSKRKEQIFKIHNSNGNSFGQFTFLPVKTAEARKNTPEQ